MKSLATFILYLSIPTFGIAQNPAAPLKALSGNWSLTPTGDNSQAMTPPISTEFGAFTLTLGVDGETVYGEGRLEIHCPNPKDHMGADVFVTGKESPDGSFTLTNTAVARDPGGVIIIHGKLPSAGASEWQATFSSTWPGSNGSCVPVYGQVEATRLPALKGTFSGTLRAGDGTLSDLTMEVAQGEMIGTNSPSPDPAFTHCNPLNATMTVKNASGPFFGTFTTGDNTSPNQCSRIGGSTFSLHFTTIDSATIYVIGDTHNSKTPAVDRVDITLHYMPNLPRGEGKPINMMGLLRRVPPQPIP